MKINDILAKIPGWLSGKVSIFIYIFLFFYLVIFALMCYVFPALHAMAPSGETHLILGNYTNIVSALGASIAAGSGAAIHSKIRTLHASHKELNDKIDDLHRKIDDMSDRSTDNPKGDK